MRETKIARVFPRKTKQSPNDSLCFFDTPKMLDLPEIDEVHISVVFTYDMQKAEDLYFQWERLGVPIKMGGPAFGEKSGEFIPGLYVKKGVTFTSRGCPNNCWFCSVHKREGDITELEIKDGYIIQDDNFLACSENHIRSVFEMLKRQKEKPHLNGGLEAKLLKSWHCELLADAKTASMYFAYDTPDDYEPLIVAGRMLANHNLTIKRRTNYCYVLIGYPKDTFVQAEKRLIDTIKAGFIPLAMLYKDYKGATNPDWRKFSREWARKEIIWANIKKLNLLE